MDTLAQLSYEDKVTRQIELADAGLRKAAADLSTVAAKEAAAQALIPQVIDTLINSGRIRPERREKLASVLVDHRETLRLLEMIAKQQTPGETRLGQGVPTDGHKQASSQASAGEVVTEATRRLFQGLRLPVPQ